MSAQEAHPHHTSLDAAFIALLPEDKRKHHRPVEIPAEISDGATDIAIEAENLTIRFGNFTAVDNVSFRIPRGEIFGFLGSNGCGKTTTMKALTGLLPASEGKARLFGREVDPRDLATRRHVGYMSQSFSLYSELTVRQNLDLHARLFHLPNEPAAQPDNPPSEAPEYTAPESRAHPRRILDWRRMTSIARRETLELRRDPIRASFALLGSLILLFVIGYGLSMDITDLPYAVLDLDQTTLSRSYTLDISGSRYFTERAPLVDHHDLDRRMRSGELSLAIEIPPGFAHDIAHGRGAEIGAWIDGAMPSRAETARGYVEGMHTHWLAQRAREGSTALPTGGGFRLEARFQYNPDVKSIVAMVPAVIVLVLLLIPTMLATLSIVREKDLGSIETSTSRRPRVWISCSASRLLMSASP